MYESQFLFTRQIFKLIDVTDFNGDLSNGKLRQVSLQHELPDNDLSQERFTHEKEHIFKSVIIIIFFLFFQIIFDIPGKKFQAKITLNFFFRFVY